MHAEVNRDIYKRDDMWQSVFGVQMVMFLCIRLPMNSESMVMVVILAIYLRLQVGSMLGAEAEKGSRSATGSDIWPRGRRLPCLVGAPEGPVEMSAIPNG